MKLQFKLTAWLGAVTAIPLLAIPAEAADNAAPTVYQGTAPTPAVVTDPTPVAAPPPAAAPKYSASQLEKLVARIALYPDPLIASILPASVYPLEIVQAARFVKDTNNLAKLDGQPWDENVKAVARVPEVIQKMDADLTWTTDLGQAFLDQQQEVMDTIQKLRGNAQKMGALQTTAQQVVIVTNMVVERTVEERVVVVTNTIVQIQPANPQIVYVPQYTPTYLYAPPPAYVYNPLAPLVTFGVGVAVGAIIANNCNWHYGGVYHGGGYYHGGGNYYRGGNNVNVNINNTVINNRQNNINAGGGGQKWQPDQNRLRTSGSPSTMQSARTQEARGWGSGSSPGSTRPSTGTPSIGTRPSAGTGVGATRPSTGQVSPGARPSTGKVPSTARPSTSPSVSRPATTPSVSRPSPSVNRASPSPSRGSAFSSGGSGASTRGFSNRGAASRGGGFGGGGGRGGGGRGR